jgi:hypothetical protein
LRKDGYRSQFIRLSRAFPTRIVLEPAELAGIPRTCSATSQCETIEGWSAEFCFPRIAGVEASRQGHDIDYGIRNYIVRSSSETAAIRHGSGPNWSFGRPVDPDVWKSVEYSEATYAAGKLVILDARGRTSDGKSWRYLGKLGESASYSGVRQDAARLLDRVLVGVCVRR